MQPQTIKDEQEATISIEAKEIELDLELLEEMIPLKSWLPANF